MNRSKLTRNIALIVFLCFLLQELIRISDERMYAAKDEYYRTTGCQRRT